MFIVRSYYWYVNDVPLNYNAYNTRPDENTGILSFSRTDGPEGYYQCKVSSAYGTAVSNVTRVVKTETQKLFSPNEVTYRTAVSKSLQIICNASTVLVIPRAFMKWQMATDMTSSSQIDDLIYDNRVQMDENGRKLMVFFN